MTQKQALLTVSGAFFFLNTCAFLVSQSRSWILSFKVFKACNVFMQKSLAYLLQPRKNQTLPSEAQ